MVGDYGGWNGGDGFVGFILDYWNVEFGENFRRLVLSLLRWKFVGVGVVV